MTRPGLGLLGALGAIAVSANLLASDLPLVGRSGGRFYVLPVLTGAALPDGAPLEVVLPTPIGFGPYAQHPGGRTDVLAPPGWPHLLGTDDRGRDVAARLVHGTRSALVVGVTAALVSLLVGLALGLAAARTRALDLVLGRLIQVGLTFPVLFLLLALGGIYGAAGPLLLGLILGLAGAPEVARLARAEGLRVGHAPHVEAARALGAGPWRIALRHVLPLASGPALVQASYGLGRAVLLEAALSFLGVGLPPPLASWGELLAQGQASGLHLNLILPPTLAITLAVLGATRLGDGMAQPGRADGASR